MALRVTDVDALVDRLARPTFVLRMARANLDGSPRMRRSTATRYANACREVKEVVDSITGAARAEAELWQLAEQAEVHARRYEPGRSTLLPNVVSQRVRREQVRTYRTRRDAYLRAIAVLRGGLYGHAVDDVLTEWKHRLDGEVAEVTTT